MDIAFSSFTFGLNIKHETCDTHDIYIYWRAIPYLLLKHADISMGRLFLTCLPPETFINVKNWMDKIIRFTLYMSKLIWSAWAIINQMWQFSNTVVCLYWRPKVIIRYSTSRDLPYNFLLTPFICSFLLLTRFWIKSFNLQRNTYCTDITVFSVAPNYYVVGLGGLEMESE